MFLIFVVYVFIWVFGLNGVIDILFYVVGFFKMIFFYLMLVGFIIGLIWDGFLFMLFLLLVGFGKVFKVFVDVVCDFGVGWWIVLMKIILLCI